MYLTIYSQTDIDRQLEIIGQRAANVRDFLTTSNDQPLQLLRRLKFDCTVPHPIYDREINFIEHVNQAWTFIVALVATQKLLTLRPEAGGFRLAPGAHASLPLDIESMNQGIVGAETFAAVNPRNNGKLANDLAKLERFPKIKHRYLFFMSPNYPRFERQPQFDRPGIEVWSVTLN